MNHKINLQARIKRHSRILKDNLGNTLHSSKKKNFGYWIVALLLLIMFPMYPAFSNTELNFDRSEIDESSILSYYDEDPLLDNSSSEAIFETKDSFLSIWSLVEETSTTKNNIVEHKVKQWDTIRLLAKKYEISEDTIRWANKLKSDYKIKIGDELSFPSVTGVIYKIKSWDTISWISVKYDISSKDISKQNNLVKNIIKPWQEIIIPGWKYIKEEIKKKKTIEKKTYAVRKNTTQKSYSRPNTSKSSYVNSKWKYKLVRRKPFSWAWWNCTYYVASYKNVNWRWNANQWLRNARKKWHKTWMNATTWSIIALWWRWYNPRYGHVWIVREVHKNHLIISDMNYRRLWQVTYRKISRYWSHIKWYIYVN